MRKSIFAAIAACVCLSGTFMANADDSKIKGGQNNAIKPKPGIVTKSFTDKLTDDCRKEKSRQEREAFKEQKKENDANKDKQSTGNTQSGTNQQTSGTKKYE